MASNGPSPGVARAPVSDSLAMVRPAAFAGRTYEASADRLRAQLARYFGHPDGAGLPDATAGPSAPPSSFRGVLSPHIDYQRGGTVYTWAYRELIERSDAEVFVIVGVAHQPCAQRFVLTRRHFATPLGVVETDHAFIDRVEWRVGRQVFEDEWAHRVEHSIEFQAVFLKYLLDGRRAFTIVPVLVGSFHDLMLAGIDPIEASEVHDFVRALRDAEGRCGKRVAYIGAIDLSHVGPDFGDPKLVDDVTLRHLDAFDGALLDRAVAGDPRGWFETARRVGNRWRVCGLAATYTMLHAMGETRGRLLRYNQAVDDRRCCCVSFASVAFEANRE